MQPLMDSEELIKYMIMKKYEEEEHRKNKMPICDLINKVSMMYFVKNIKHLEEDTNYVGLQFATDVFDQEFKTDE